MPFVLRMSLFKKKKHPYGSHSYVCTLKAGIHIEMDPKSDLFCSVFVDGKFLKNLYFEINGPLGKVF